MTSTSQDNSETVAQPAGDVGAPEKTSTITVELPISLLSRIGVQAGHRRITKKTIALAALERYVAELEREAGAMLPVSTEPDGELA